MPGIVVTFNEQTNNTLIELYNHINEKLKDEFILTNKIPHISLMRIQRNFTESTLNIIENVVTKIKIKNISFKINSIGMFKKSKKKFVLYLTPVNDKSLRYIHQKVWKSLSKNMNLLEKDYYSPDCFTPHITIPVKHPTKTNILNICRVLMNTNYFLKGSLNKISFINTSKKTGEQQIIFN